MCRWKHFIIVSCYLNSQRTKPVGRAHWTNQMESIKRVTQHLQTSENTKRAQENASQGLCLQRSGLSQIQPSPVHQLERQFCLMHCLKSWLFISNTLHYRAYVARPVYRSLARTEATSTPNPNKLKHLCCKRRSVLWISINWYLCQIKGISKGPWRSIIGNKKEKKLFWCFIF